jgi:hypothetical protein
MRWERAQLHTCDLHRARHRPCPLRARWVSQTRELTVTHGQAEMLHDLSTGTRPWVWSNGSPQFRSMIVHGFVHKTPWDG